MKPISVLKEAGLNLASGTTRYLQFITIFAVLIGALVGSEISSVVQIMNQGREFRAAGGSTIIIEAANHIDGAQCNALGRASGVSAAVAIRRATDDVIAVALPNDTIPTYESSHDLNGLVALGIDPNQQGVLVSGEVAQAFALEPGDSLKTTSGEIPIAGSYQTPDDGRTPGLGYAMVVPTNTDHAFDQCWIEVWPQSPTTNTLLRTTVTPHDAAADEAPPRISQLNSSHGSEFAGPQQFATRISQYATLAGTILGTILGALSIRIRRLEVASNLHAGIGRVAQTAQLLLETFAWTISSALILIAAETSALVWMAEMNSPTLWVLGLKIIGCSTAGTLLGALTMITLTRESQLFRYFKDR